MASTAPPSGAPKIAPMPEPIPVATAIRPSAGSRSRSAGQQRSEACADLARRAFSAARATRADGEGRRHDLDDHGTEADTPRVVVHRRDGGVGAVPFGLGGDAEDQDRAEQRADPGDEREGPRAGGRARRRQPAFAFGRRHLVAGAGRSRRSGCRRRAPRRTRWRRDPATAPITTPRTLHFLR